MSAYSYKHGPKAYLDTYDSLKNVYQILISSGIWKQMVLDLELMKKMLILNTMRHWY